MQSAGRQRRTVGKEALLGATQLQHIDHGVADFVVAAIETATARGHGIDAGDGFADQGVETLFLRWAKQEGIWDGDEEEEKKIRGRGAPAKLQEEEISPPIGPVEVGPADVQLRRLGNLVRRVQHLVGLQASALRSQVEARRL